MADNSRTTPRIIGKTVLRPRQQVEETIRTAILSGDLKSGEMLPPETELARQFNVSRTTLREALRVLSAERLIVKIPGAHGGNIVQAVDHTSLGGVLIDSVDNLLAIGSIDFEEVANVREYLEIPSVRLAAINRSEPELAELQEIVNRQKAASVDDPEIAELDGRFHTLIAQASHNRVLTSLVAALHHATEPVRYLDLSPEVGRETVKQHQAIVDAIRDGDAARGEKAIITHLRYLREHIMAHRQDNAAT